MPPDVPVIAVGVGNIGSAIKICKVYLSGFKRIALIEKKGGAEKEYSEKCKAFMEENRIPFEVYSKAAGDSVCIDFVELGKKPSSLPNVLSVPVKEDSGKSDALEFLDSFKDAYSVGLNNYRNAAIAALELANPGGNYSGQLSSIRKKAAKKVLDSNR